jgi:hypothetical protein
MATGILLLLFATGSRDRYERVVVPTAGHPDWIEQGPGSISPTEQYNLSGAIESVLVDPTNPRRIFIGSVNGGVWQTDDGTDAVPLWTTGTDQAPSLSIADLHFDPADPTMNTVYAAVGRYSSFEDGEGGALSGLLRTQDGGSHWVSLGGSSLGGVQLRTVLPTTAIAASGGHVVLVASSSGIFRSTDGGVSAIHLGAAQGLPPGDAAVSSLIGDPNSSLTFFAAFPRHGIYRSTDAGGTWENVSANIPIDGTGGIGSASIIKLAPSAALPHPIYAAVATNHIAGLFRTTSEGAAWTSLSVPSPQLNVSNSLFAFAADPIDPGIVYAAGDQPINNLQMGKIDPSGAVVWSACTGPKPATSDGSSQHGDSRSITFDSDGYLVLSDDGGIFRLANPRDATRRSWRGINGTLRITEVNSVAYDTLNAIAFSGHQDTGSAQQSTEQGGFWDVTAGGDGTEQGVDNSANDRSIRFITTGGDLADTLTRTTYGSQNQIVQQPRTVVLAAPQTPGVKNSGLLAKRGYGGFTLNLVAPSRMLLFGGALYEGVVKSNGTGDYGDTIRSIALPDAVNVEDNVHTAATYGGWLAGTPNPGLLYVGFRVQEAVPSSSQLVEFQRLYLRTGDGAPVVKLPFPDATIMGVASDPYDWRIVYALGASRVYKSTNAGQAWTDITRDLPLQQVRSVRVIQGVTGTADGDAVAVAGANGVYASEAGGTAAWLRLGGALPNTLVNDMQIYPAAVRVGHTVGQTLVVGTIGRGVWTWPFNVWRVNLGKATTFDVHTWAGAWGSDGPIITGDFNGDGKTDVMMWRNATKSWTVNLSTGSGFNALEWKGAWGSDGPIITGDFNGDGKTDVMMWRNATKSWTVNLSTGSGFNALEWKGAWGSDGPIITGDFNGDSKTDVVMWRP